MTIKFKTNTERYLFETLQAIAEDCKYPDGTFRKGNYWKIFSKADSAISHVIVTDQAIKAGKINLQKAIDLVAEIDAYTEDPYLKGIRERDKHEFTSDDGSEFCSVCGHSCIGHE